MEKEIKKISNISDTKSIVEDLSFIKATAGLNFKQLLFILKLASDVEKKDNEFNVYSYSVSEIAKLYTINNRDNKSKKSVMDMIDELFEMTTIIKTETGYIKIHRIEAVEYNKYNEVISFHLGNKLKPFLIKLSKNMVITNYDIIKKLSTKSAIQLYRYLKRFTGFTDANGNIKAKELNIDSLKEIIYGKEIANYRFIEDYIKPAIENINQNTDLYIEYETIKSKQDKRKIDKLKFMIKFQNGYNNEYLERRKKYHEQAQSNNLKELSKEEIINLYNEMARKLCETQNYDLYD